MVKKTVAQRQLDWEELCKDEAVLLLNKGNDYTAGRAEEDAYANFRIIADLLKDVPVSAFSVALIYFLKHVLSVVTYAKTGKQESVEPLRGRFMDIRNYAFILSQLTEDHGEMFKNAVIQCWGGTLDGETIITDQEGFLIPRKGVKVDWTDTGIAASHDLGQFDPDDYTPSDVVPHIKDEW